MSGTEVWRPPVKAGKVVGIVQFKGRVILAMEGGVFFLNEGNKLEPVEFVQSEQEMPLPARLTVRPAPYRWEP